MEGNLSSTPCRCKLIYLYCFTNNILYPESMYLASFNHLHFLLLFYIGFPGCVYFQEANLFGSSTVFMKVKMFPVTISYCFLSFLFIFYFDNLQIGTLCGFVIAPWLDYRYNKVIRIPYFIFTGLQVCA